MITLDSDTELPRDAARRLVGAMAHPLNRAVIDPADQDGRRGIRHPAAAHRHQHAVGDAELARQSLLRARPVSTSTRARSRTCIRICSARAVFTGKGIYEVDAFRESLEQRFPANTLLSHDLIEGVFARAGLVSDIELIDDYPTHFSAYSRRKHRWMRGDWQILRWLLNRRARLPAAGWSTIR